MGAPVIFASPSPAELPPQAENCPLCGGRLGWWLDCKVPNRGEEYRLLRCVRCHLGVTTPAPEDLGPYYANYYGGRHGGTAAFRARRRYKLLARIFNSGGRASAAKCLLDVGCGDGEFLSVAQRAGWRVAGTEMNPGLARARGLRVYESVMEAAAAETEKNGLFDCVTLWHSLEHLRDPRKALLEANRVLAEDGWLLIAVPNARGWQARLFGPHWLHLDVPRHLFHFDLQALAETSRSAGFEVVRCRHQEFEYDVMGWVQSSLNCLLPTPNVLFDSLRHAPRQGSILKLALSWIAGVVLVPLSLPLVWLGALAAQGGTVVVAFRKIAKHGN